MSGVVEPEIGPSSPANGAAPGHGGGEALRIQLEIQIKVKPRRCGPDGVCFVFHTGPDLPFAVGSENDLALSVRGFPAEGGLFTSLLDPATRWRYLSAGLLTSFQPNMKRQGIQSNSQFSR